MQTLWQDLRYGLRMLRKNPGFFTTVAVVTLAMAIGANAVVFSAVNGLILRPLNVPHAESLFQVGGPNDPSHPYPDYLDLRDRNRSFDGLAAHNFTTAGLDTGKNPSRAWVSEMSGSHAMAGTGMSCQLVKDVCSKDGEVQLEGCRPSTESQAGQKSAWGKCGPYYLMWAAE